MNDIKDESAGDGREARAGVAGERDALTVERARETLRRALAEDEEARDELRDVASDLLLLQARAAEWQTLHHLLHQVLTAFLPFHAQVARLGDGDVGASERRALLRSWRLCQGEVDRLVSFAETVEHIGSPFRREGRKLRGERWAVDVVALQLLIEDVLKEDGLSPTILLELAEAFENGCQRHLILTDRRLDAAFGRLHHLSTRLLGGLV